MAINGVGGQSTVQRNLQQLRQNNSQDPDFDTSVDDSLESPTSNSAPAAQSSDIQDTFVTGSDWHEPTFGAGSQWVEPTHTSNSFGEALRVGVADQGTPDCGLPPYGRLDENGLLVHGTGIGLEPPTNPTIKAPHCMLAEDGTSKFGFTAAGKAVINSAFFEHADNEQAFRLKQDASPSAAIKDIINAPKGKYGFECATAISVQFYMEQYFDYQQRFGAEADARFNLDFKGMQMGPWGEAGPHMELTNMGGVAQYPANLGEGRYFANNQVDYAGTIHGWRGENTLYAGKALADGPIDPTTGAPRYLKGDDLYFGHPFGITSGRNIEQALLGHARRVNGEAGDALREAMRSATGQLRSDLAELHDAFMQVGERRAAHEAAMAELDARYQAEQPAKGTPEYNALNKRWQETLGQDAVIDRAEAAVQLTARRLLEQINLDISRVRGPHTHHQRQILLQQVQQQRQALLSIIPGDHMITEHVRVPIEQPVVGG